MATPSQTVNCNSKKPHRNQPRSPGYALFRGPVTPWTNDLHPQHLTISREEVGALDQLTVGQYSRSQVMRIVLQDFLKKPEKEQPKFLTNRAFAQGEVYPRLAVSGTELKNVLPPTRPGIQESAHARLLVRTKPSQRLSALPPTLVCSFVEERPGTLFERRWGFPVGFPSKSLLPHGVQRGGLDQSRQRILNHGNFQKAG